MLVMAKSAALYRGRIGNSIGLLVLGAAFAAIYHFAGLRAVSSMVQSVAGIFIVICLFAGVHLTADAIAQEKREGTLGLLFLTPLTPFQIVLGKMVACSLSGFYWLLIAVPLLSLMLIVGGLSGREMVMLVAAGLNTLFLSAAAGLLASTRHTERKKAAALGSWIMIFFWMGAPGLALLFGKLDFQPWTVRAMELLGIGGAMIMFAGPAPRTFSSPWINLGVLHLVGWIFVALATWSLKRNWQEVSARKRQTFREWWKNLSLGKPEVRLRLRLKLLDRNAFLWLASRDRLRALGVWIATAIFVVATGVSVAVGGLAAMVVVMLTFAICFFHRGGVAATSAHQLQMEYEQGTLEMIMSTPLAAEEIIRGQILAARRLFRGPVMIVLIMHALAIVVLLAISPGGNEYRTAALVAVHGAMFLFDFYTLAWAGMWCLMFVRDGRNAAGAAIVRVTLVPVIIVILGMTAGGVAGWYFDFAFEPSFPQIVMSWLAVAILNNLWWLRQTRKNLPEQLRIFAMKRYSPQERLTWLGGLGRWLGTKFRGAAGSNRSGASASAAEGV